MWRCKRLSSSTFHRRKFRVVQINDRCIRNRRRRRTKFFDKSSSLSKKNRCFDFYRNYIRLKSENFNLMYIHLDFTIILIQDFLSIFNFFITSLRYLQSKVTSHEELNRVRNIFRDCRSILLNFEMITRYWKNRKIDDREKIEDNWSIKSNVY